MKRREKSDLRGLKVTFEAVAGRQGGRGIFAIEDEAEEVGSSALNRGEADL